MHTHIRKLGNSKGLIIPASFLSNLGIEDSVEMVLKEHSIVITPVKSNPREGWYTNYNTNKDENSWQDFKTLSSEEENWEW